MIDDSKPENPEDKNPKDKEKEKKEPHPNAAKKKADLPWDKILGWHGFHQSVFVYSYYFKKAGMPQKLSFGDWYFTLPNYQPFLYVKREVDTYEDLQFILSGKYVRIVSPDECWGVILSCNFVPVDFDFALEEKDKEIRLTVRNADTGDLVGVTGHNVHEVLISVALKVYLLSKNMSDFSQEIMEMPNVPNESDDEE